jgi:hypothetical protein
MELVDAHKKETRLEQQLIKAKSEDLTIPLQQAQQQLDEYCKQLANYEKDKETLEVHTSFIFFLWWLNYAFFQKTWQRQKLLQRKHDNLKRENTSLELERERQETEIKRLKERLTTLESEKHKSAGLVSLVHEHKLKALSSQLEVREAQLNQVLSSCNSDAAEVAENCKKLEVNQH